MWKGILRAANNDDVAPQPTQDLHRAFQEGVEESELHEDENYGKRDARNGYRQPPHVVRQILPSQRRAELHGAWIKTARPDRPDRPCGSRPVPKKRTAPR